jgi:hypothetical protein
MISGIARKSSELISAFASQGGIIYAILAALVVLPAMDAIQTRAAADVSIRAQEDKRPKSVPTPNVLPANIKARLPVYTPGPMPYHDGEVFVFQASWIGIPAAQARFKVRTSRMNAAHWIAEGWVQTNAFADVFFRMRDYVREEIVKEGLVPDEMYILQRENQRQNEYTVRFDRPASMVTITKHNHKGNFSREFISENGLGMISGGLMALSQPLQPGKTYNFDIFSGTERYVFSFDVTDREHVHMPLGEFDAWRIVPDVLYWSDGNLKGEGRDTVLWISADNRRLPLRIQSATFIGYVRADLIEVDDGQVMRAQ